MHSNNLLTSSNGASIFSYSSSKGRSEASSILSSEKGVWVSEEGLPQSLTIDISHLNFHPDINFFGWFCWHSYSSNPSLVELHVASKEDSFTRWGVFQAQLSTKPQIFSIEPLNKATRFIKIVVLETFGATNCYLNKVFLLEKMIISKKNKNFDESMVNISEISSNSHEVKDFNGFERNFKSKLRFQLEELEESVKFLKEKYDKPDEIDEIREEVRGCQGKMMEITEGLRDLMAKVNKVEKNAKILNNNKNIQTVKAEILNEIRNRKRRKEKSKQFNRVTDRFRETKASDILALIQLKTEQKMAKMMELETEQRRLSSP
jgi:hypothetical protein